MKPLSYEDTAAKSSLYSSYFRPECQQTNPFLSPHSDDYSLNCWCLSVASLPRVFFSLICSLALFVPRRLSSLPVVLFYMQAVRRWYPWLMTLREMMDLNTGKYFLFNQQACTLVEGFKGAKATPQVNRTVLLPCRQPHASPVFCLFHLSWFTHLRNNVLSDLVHRLGQRPTGWIK